MKAISFLALTLVTLGMSAQGLPDPAPANAAAAAASGSATIKRLDYHCYEECRREGGDSDDCYFICEIPDSNVPIAAASAKPALQKRDYQCYLACTAGCHDGDNKCMDRCAWRCAGSDRPRP